MRDLDVLLFEKETLILEEIYKVINECIIEEEQDYIELYNQTIKLIYISLRQTCQIVADFMDETNDDEFPNKEIDELTYSDDGLTLRDRVMRAIRQGMTRQTIESKRSIIRFGVTRILDNETRVVKNKLIKRLALEEKIEYGFIIPGGGCTRECCNIEDNVPKPIDEIDLPPYHPNCGCELVLVDPEGDDELL